MKSEITKLIEEAGGNAAFSRALEIPLSTVEGWKAGKHIAEYNVKSHASRLRELGIIKTNKTKKEK